MTVTELLHEARRGDREAENELLALVYEGLCHCARATARDWPTTSLQPTELVHEAYLRLVEDERLRAWDKDRAYFFAAAARAMRQALVDRHRRKCATKRGGDRDREPLSQVDVPASRTGEELDLLALDEALERLEVIDPRAFQVVHHHFFLGLSMPEIGELLGIAERTARKDWEIANRWLHRELSR